MAKKKRRYRKNCAAYKEAVHTRLTAWRRRKLSRLSEAQNHRCAYCQRKTYFSLVKPEGMKKNQRATLDHYIPVSKPVQTNKDDNLIMACWLCNTLRGDRNPIAFYERLHQIVEQKPWLIPQPSPKPKKKSAKKIAKEKDKEGRCFIYLYLMFIFWPQQAHEILDAISKLPNRPKRERIPWQVRRYRLAREIAEGV